MEEKKKKKKGRPSLLDLQKRSLREQQEKLQQQNQQIHHIKPNPNFNSPTTTTPIRRSTRRNSDHAPLSNGADSISGDKYLLQFPNGEGEGEGNHDDDENCDRKFNLNAIWDGSAPVQSKLEEKHVPGTIPTVQGGGVDGGPFTPLPDTTLLMFIIDGLQKKDTHGVFSEPVDPEELPDYHEIIDNPMDFATLKQKLSAGQYTYLEQFERDVFLICSNAMQYNSPNTIYFRQARSIQELAKKNFENLRQDSDDSNEPAPAPKIARRGRPPTKHLTKMVSEPSLERASTEFSDAKLASGGENTNTSGYDLRRGPLDSTRRYNINSSKINGSYACWSTEQKLDRNEELSGSVLKRVKQVKNHFVCDDGSRRNSYEQYEPSVIDPFDGEKKMLLAVGLHTEHGYARSLARYAASLGPLTWKIASKKMQRCLPPGVKFGPGWVGEADIALPATSTSFNTVTPTSFNLEGSNSSIKSGGATMNSGSARVVASRMGTLHQQPSWQGLSSQQKLELGPTT